jgi:hypothetical protein
MGWEENRAKRKARKQCSGNFCDKPDDVSNKKIKGPRKKRTKKKKGPKKFVAQKTTTTQGETRQQAKPAQDVQAHVFDSSGYSSDVAEATGGGDFQKARNIGMSTQASTAFAKKEGGFQEGSDLETTNPSGLKTQYINKGLYKQTGQGLKKKRSYQHISEGGEDLGGGTVSPMRGTELTTQKGGRVKTFKSKEGMDREEVKARKDLGTGTKYVSEKKIARKKTRMDKSMTEKKPKMKTRQQVKRSRKKGRKIESLNEKQLADRGQTL